MKIDDRRVSKQVKQTMGQLYALMASQAARRAIGYIEYNKDPENAERMAAAAEKWLIRAGALHAHYTFKPPSLI